MTTQEAVESLKRRCVTFDGKVTMVKDFIEALDIAVEALEKQDVLLELLVDFESEYVCDEIHESECGCEWCDEHCKYQSPQKECYLKYAEIRLR